MRKTLLKSGALASVLAAAAFGAFALTGSTPPEQLTDSQSVVQSTKSISLQTRADEYEATYEWYRDGATTKESTEGYFSVAKTDNSNVGYNSNYKGSFKTFDGKSVTCTSGLKVESKTQITFTPSKKCDVRIVQANAATSSTGTIGTLKFNGVVLDKTNVDETNGVIIYTVSKLDANTACTISRGGGDASVLYVGVGYIKDSSKPSIKWEGNTTVSYYEGADVSAVELPTLKNDDNLKVTITSDNDAVASVNADGTITLHNDILGVATITATADDDATITSSFTIECKTKEPTIVEINTPVAGEPNKIWSDDMTCKIQDEVKSVTDADKNANKFEAGYKLIDNDALTAEMPYASVFGGIKVSFWGRDLTHYAQIRADKAPSADNVIGTEKTDQSPLVITPKKDMTLVLFGRRQIDTGKDKIYEEDVYDEATNTITKNYHYNILPNDGKSLKIVDQAEPTKLLPNHFYIDSYTSPDKDTKVVGYVYIAQFVELKANKTYTAFCTGCTFQLYAIGYQNPYELEVKHNDGILDFGDTRYKLHYAINDGEQTLLESEDGTLDINNHEAFAPGTVHKVTPYKNGIAGAPVHVLTAPTFEYEVVSDPEYGEVVMITPNYDNGKVQLFYFPKYSMPEIGNDSYSSRSVAEDLVLDGYIPYDEESAANAVLMKGMVPSIDFVATAAHPEDDTLELVSKTVTTDTYDVVTGVSEVLSEDFTGAKMYDLNGREVKGQAAPGIYVLVKGNKSVKVVIR